MIGSVRWMRAASTGYDFASPYVGRQTRAQASYCLIIVVEKSVVSSLQLLRSSQRGLAIPRMINVGSLAIVGVIRSLH